MKVGNNGMTGNMYSNGYINATNDSAHMLTAL